MATLHRQENTDDLNRLRAIIIAFNYFAKDLKVIVPLHPRTRKIIEKEKFNTSFTIIEPAGYFNMLELLKHSKLVLTDCGGLQKVAYFINEYCITLRNETGGVNTKWLQSTSRGGN